MPVVRRGELTDEAWAVIAPLLPEAGGARGRWRGHRQVINGILWKLRTGAPWRDLPERFGPWKTCHERLRRWSADGTWDRTLAAAQVHDDGTPVHGRSALTRRSCGRISMPWHPQKGGSSTSAATPGAQDGEAIGRSRGGLSTKIHLAVDGRGRPLSILLTPGGAGDNPSSWRCSTRSASTSRDRAGPASVPTY
ncbi:MULTISPECIES: IS5 family transposase [Micromonospora]|uniref:IS5 family transposase n=1 Tax=Micromonospora TaxID=1873 RepID=UPI00331BEF4D